MFSNTRRASHGNSCKVTRKITQRARILTSRGLCAKSRRRSRRFRRRHSRNRHPVLITKPGVTRNLSRSAASKPRSATFSTGTRANLGVVFSCSIFDQLLGRIRCEPEPGAKRGHTLARPRARSKISESTALGAQTARAASVPLPAAWQQDPF